MRRTSTLAIVLATLLGPTACAGGKSMEGTGTAPTGPTTPACSAGAWSKSFLNEAGWNPSYATVSRVAVGAGGDLIVVGVFEGTMDIGSGTLTSKTGTGIFVADLDCAGDVKWARHLGDWSHANGTLQVNGAAVDAAGNVFIAGTPDSLVQGSTLDFGKGPLPAAPFALKLSPAGELLWGKTYGTPDDNDLHGVAVAASGDSYWTGVTSDLLSFGGAPITGYVVFALDPDGNPLWSKSIGGDAKTNSGAAVLVDAVDAEGNVVLCGGSQSDDTPPIDLGGGPLAPGLFVGTLDGTGAHRWSKSFTAMGASGWGTECGEVGVDPSGQIVLSGTYWAYQETPTSTVTVDFDGKPVAIPGVGSSGGATTVIARLTAAGDTVFASLPGGINSDDLGGVAGGAGAVFATGIFMQDPLDFGGHPLASPTPVDTSSQMFLVKLGEDGSYDWAKAYAISGLDKSIGYVGNLVVDPAGMVVVGGGYAGAPDFGQGALPSGLGPAFLARIAP